MPDRVVSDNTPAVVKPINIAIGKSVLLELPRDVRDVMVADPKVANAIVRSTRNIFIVGVGEGGTTVFAIDAEGKQIAAYDVTIGGRNIDVLRQTLKSIIPTGQIVVNTAGDSVVLTGTVATAADAVQAADVAVAFLGNNGLKGGKIINALTVQARDQVMIKVTVAEIKRTALKQLGVDANGSWNIGKFDMGGVLDNPFGANVGPIANTAFGVGNVDRFGIQTYGGKLRAMERSGVLRTLAEPTVSAISGETARFLAGGEIPILAGYNCENGFCRSAVEYKKYGVSLTFTPVVLSAGRISVRVGTEVSEVDPTNSVKTDAIAVPGFKTRRSETVVELPSGGTMVTAGLMQRRANQSMDGIPGLKNIPILGTLFRSRDYQREETELMISVTPYIARPMAASAVSRPDDGFTDSTDLEAYLLGRFQRAGGKVRNEKIRAARGNRPVGRPAFITE